MEKYTIIASEESLVVGAVSQGLTDLAGNPIPGLSFKVIAPSTPEEWLDYTNPAGSQTETGREEWLHFLKSFTYQFYKASTFLSGQQGGSA